MKSQDSENLKNALVKLIGVHSMYSTFLKTQNVNLLSVRINN